MFYKYTNFKKTIGIWCLGPGLWTVPSSQMVQCLGEIKPIYGEVKEAKFGSNFHLWTTRSINTRGHTIFYMLCWCLHPFNGATTVALFHMATAETSEVTTSLPQRLWWKTQIDETKRRFNWEESRKRGEKGKVRNHQCKTLNEFIWGLKCKITQIGNKR